MSDNECELDENDDEVEVDDEEMPYSAVNIDVDAVASAKSLGDAMRLLAPQLEGLPRRSRGKYGKRKHLSAEEKAELTRRRNRENARSTRMRRKMYITHLQQVAETLKDRHDELHKKMLQPPPDGYSRQREAARRFFEMRGNCETRPDMWLDSVDKDIEVTVPLTPHRTCYGTFLPHCRQLRGVSALVTDSRSLQQFLTDLASQRGQHVGGGGQNKKQKRTAATLVITVDPGSIVHVGTSYMCQWTAKIALVESEKDLQVSVSHSGMARCSFHPDHHTLSRVDLRFDVSAFLTALHDFVRSPPPAASTTSSSSSPPLAVSGAAH